MKPSAFFRAVRVFAQLLPKPCKPSLQCRPFHHDFVPRDHKTKPKRYKHPAVYDPYGPRPPPFDKIVQLVDHIAPVWLKESKDLVEKLLVLVKQGVTKEEANDIIEKIKGAGGVAVME